METNLRLSFVSIGGKEIVNAVIVEWLPRRYIRGLDGLLDKEIGKGKVWLKRVKVESRERFFQCRHIPDGPPRGPPRGFPRSLRERRRAGVRVYKKENTLPCSNLRLQVFPTRFESEATRYSAMVRGVIRFLVKCRPSNLVQNGGRRGGIRLIRFLPSSSLFVYTFFCNVSSVALVTPLPVARPSHAK